ncbi:MAG: hypothetical protein ACUX7D_01100 [Candidatus Methanodesulfokora washburnensis]
MPYYISCGVLELMLPDRRSKAINISIIVNPHVDEIVMSDYEVSELGIMLLDFKRAYGGCR